MKQGSGGTPAALDARLGSGAEEPPSSSTSELFEGTPALAPGDRLGRYQVVALLGAGGMGEVYVARDLRLGRQVALKVLHPTHTQDRSRLRRFVREARVASLLSHPNIVATYDFGSYRGLAYLVTELLSGRTLREELDGGALGVDRVLRYGIQIARALAAAHDAGAAHRDIKPGNVFVLPDGGIKLLDFGLAKLLFPETERAGREEETVTGLSVTHAVVGSVGYMSPEQAQGLAIDHRTDLFSLGVLLHEMLSGERPFRRSTTLETMMAIVKEPPPPLRGAPRALAAIVARCLEKNPHHRFQSARDLVFALEASAPVPTGRIEAVIPPERGSVTTAVTRRLAEATRSTLSTAVTAVRRRPGLSLLVLVLLGLVLTLLLELVATGPAPGALVSAGTDSAAAVTIERVTTSGRVGQVVALAPDGEYAVYSDESEERGLWLVHLGTGSRARISPSGELYSARFTPDGDHIFYVGAAEDGAGPHLWRIPRLGGDPLLVARDVSWSSPPAISPTGDQVAFVRDDRETGASALVVVSPPAPGEQVLALREGAFFACAWSPLGTPLLCSVLDASGDSAMVEVDAASGEQRTLAGFPPLVTPAWLPDGRGLVGEMGAGPRRLWRVSYPHGRAHWIGSDLGDYHSPTVSRDGRLLAALRIENTTNLWTLRLDDSGSMVQITTGVNTDDGNHGVTATRDGRIVWASLASGRSLDLWIAEADGSGRRRLTFDDQFDERRPDVSPDGRTVVYMREPVGAPRNGSQTEIWRVAIDGGDPAPLVTGGFARNPKFTADGQHILFSRRQGQEEHLFEIPLAGGPARPLADRPAWGPAPSPDGQWLLVHTEAEGRAQIEIWPADGRGETRVLPFSGPTKRWRPDGRAFALIRGGSVWLYDLESEELSELTRLPPGHIVAWGFDFSPDGESLVFSRRHQTRDLVTVSGLAEDPWTSAGTR